MKKTLRALLVGVLLVLTVAALSSCVEELEDHVIPDGTYKVVFYPDQDPVKVEFKNGKIVDPAHEAMFWDYKNGLVGSFLYPNEEFTISGFVANGYAVYDYNEKDAKWECHGENDLKKIEPGDTLYVEWNSFTVNVTLMNNDVPYGNRQNRNYGETVQYFTPEMSGMHFLGWFNYDGTVQYSVGGTPCFGMDVINESFPFSRNTRSITMYAVYQSIQLTVKLDLGNGQSEKFSADREKKITQEMLPKPNVENQVFLHWSASPNGEPFEGIGRDDLTLYAVWKYFKPTVYHTGSSAGDLSVDVYLGEPHSPETPIRPGYRFTGWYANAECTGEAVDLSSMSYETLLPHYYAGWQKTSYTLKFANGEFPDIVYNYGYGTDYLPVLSKSGYIFEGWCTDAACETAPVSIFGADAYGDFTLYPKFTPRTYTLTLEGDGANKTVTVTYGESYQLEVPKQEGKTFKGWYSAAGVQYTDAQGKSLKPYENLENIRLHAVYEEDAA